MEAGGESEIRNEICDMRYTIFEILFRDWQSYIINNKSKVRYGGEIESLRLETGSWSTEFGLTAQDFPYILPDFSGNGIGGKIIVIETERIFDFFGNQFYGD